MTLIKQKINDDVRNLSHAKQNKSKRWLLIVGSHARIHEYY